MIKVVNIRNWDGENYEYIGRGKESVLGNPYKVGRDGDRSEVVEKYRSWLWKEYKKRNGVYRELVRLAKLSKNRDVYLGCWCKPLRCHGDIVKNCLEWMVKNWEDVLHCKEI